MINAAAIMKITHRPRCPHWPPE